MNQAPPSPLAPPKQKTVSNNYAPKVSPGFGHIDDFWKRYDELADRSDREMIANLNNNLDVLLIFAGLFSAVNTAFISAAMPSLSPNPSDRTNALLELLVLRSENSTGLPPETSPPFSPSQNSITANCFLYSSLCCSLTAAVGAMLAKEWLQSYSRSGQAGPLEEQVRFRQGKYTAAQEWHLESVILFLPNLLLLSVLLFFTGLSFFLFPVNMTVGVVVIAFFSVGIALSSATIVAGAVSPFCPYQTAISRAIRRAVSLLVRFRGGVQYLLEHLTAAVISKRSIRWMGVVIRRQKEELQEFFGWTNASILGDEDELSRPSSLHVTLSEDGRRSSHTAQDRSAPRFPALIPISKFITERVVDPIGTYAKTLFRVFHSDAGGGMKQVEASDREQHVVNVQAASWLLEMTSSLEDQLTVAQNICCIDPTACDIVSLYPGIGDRLLSLTVEAVHTCQNQPSDRNITIAEQFGAAFYHIMLCHPQNHELWNQLRQKLPVDSFLSRGTSVMPELANVLWGTEGWIHRPKQSHSFRKMILHNMIVSFSDRWTLEGRHMFMASYDDAVLSLLALQICLRIGKDAASIDIRIGQNIQNLATKAYMGANLDRNLADALPAVVSSIIADTSDRAYDKSHAAYICAVFLERIRLSIDQRTVSPLLQQALSACLPQLMAGFATLGNHEFELARLSTVVLGTFRALERLQPRGVYEDTTIEAIYNTLQYAIVASDRNHLFVDSLSLGNYILETLTWISFSEHFDLRTRVANYPRVVARIASSFKASPDLVRDRWIAVIHRNLTGIVHARNLSVWEDAELGAHLVGYLKKATNLSFTTPTSIIRHLISLSVNLSTELLAAGIMDVISEVSEKIIGWPGWTGWIHGRRQGMYMELLDLALKVWGATLRSWSSRSVRWPAESTIRALCTLMPHVSKAKVMSRVSAGGKVALNNLQTLPFLVDYLRKLKPEAAFIARNLDVSINRLFDTPESRFGWNYPLYTHHRPSMPCSRPGYSDSRLL